MAYQKNFTTTYIINGREYRITAPALFDSETHEILADLELDDRAAEMARSQYRVDMGLLTPQEIKDYRTKIGLTQEELSELTNLNPQLIAIYEAGEFPSKKDNQVLTSLIKSDHVLLQLINDSKAHFSPQLIAKVNAYLNHTQVKKVSQKPEFTVNQLANWLEVESYFIDEALTQLQLTNILDLAYETYLETTGNELFTPHIIDLQGENYQDQKPNLAAMNDYNLVSTNEKIVDLLSQILRDFDK
ncbi:toxin-antitoxin system, antitoxin component, Xre domain protein [Lactobacillus intestinalis]|uniref:toxin-antitoxin system, antitoxin component, Xre domain protein n=1 Tax=Lactobacillus intestinalis TaxID=151781 RepID=UPI0015B17754|nr:toxin-antitoxin system, antitoxin component, Xre domain protein [Lactobacillus intestinalis]